MIDKQFFISSCDDVELGIKRNSKLEYRLSSPQNPKAIFFIIGGFGTNTDLRMMDFTRKQIASKFGVAAVNVLYHCFCCRRNDLEQQYSAQITILEEDRANLIKLCQDVGLPYANLTSTEALKFIEESIQKEKKKGNLAKEFRINSLTYTLIPSNEEYQNYGIMAALDHINALKDLVKRFPKFADLPKIYGGGSYGGYLSLLIAKIAPWYVDGVIDNSGTVLPLLRYIIGRDLEQCDFIFNHPNTLIEMFTKTYWTREDENLPYFFANENYMIRSLLNSSHLIIQVNVNKNIVLVSYHSSKDEFNTSKDKQTLFLAYKELGYDATLYLIKDESEVDGRFIKDLNHGMRITDRALFRKELPLMLEKLQKRKSFMQENSISYPCGNKVFTFKDVGDKFELEIKD